MTSSLPFALAILATTVLVSPAPAQTGAKAAASFGTSALCYDEARQRLIAFTQDGVNDIGDVWEHDGHRWARIGISGIAAFSGATYDPIRERVLLVSQANDLFEYDGATLTFRGAAATRPSRMVVDTVRSRLVAVVVNGLASRIEELIGTSWTTVATLPANRIPTNNVFDPSRGRTIIQVARTSPPLVRELWEWDGTSLSGPLQAGHQFGLLAYDPVNAQTLFNGVTGLQLWNGITFTALGVTLPPLTGNAATDTLGGRVLFFSRDEILSWNGTTLASTFRTPLPIMFRSHATQDPLRGRVVMLANRELDSLSPIHMEWNGAEWLPVMAAPVQPPSVFDHAQAFDAARNETVVFGGQNPATSMLFASTYAWNGSVWRAAAQSGPSPRSHAAIAYDSVRQRIVLVGGRAAAGAALAQDHWEWDGAAWQLVAATTPMGFSPGCMGYDPIRNRLVLLTESRQTYEYIGTSWTQIPGQGPRPGARNLAWNPVTGLLQAALGNANFEPRNFTWNGASWTEGSPAIGETAIDPLTGAAVLQSLTRTFVQSDALADSSSYGIGCGGSSTTTSLVAFDRPIVGSQRFHLDVRADARSMPAFIGFGQLSAIVPLGNGCSLLLADLLTTLVGFTDAAGFLHQPLPLPAGISLRGLTVQAQGVVLDPAFPGGLAITQGLTLLLGD